MKKLIVAASMILLLPAYAFSWGAAGMCRSTEVAAAGGSCISGTYLYYWDGDYSGSTVTACVDSGNSTNVGTQSGGVLTTTNCEGGSTCFEIDGTGTDIITWTDDVADFLPTAAWTACFRVYKVDDATDAEMHWFETYGGSNDFVTLSVRSDERPIIRMEYDNVLGSLNAAAEALSKDTWQTMCYSFNYVDGTNDVLAIMNCGVDDDCDGDAWTTGAASMAGTAFGTDPTDFTLGAEHDAQGTDTIRINKFTTMSGYQTGLPTGW